MNFRNFMNGRYGTDQLTIALLVLGMIITFLANAFEWHTITMLTYLIFFVCAFRIMSKNRLARQKENNMFLKYYNPTQSWLKLKYKIAKSSKDYKYFQCPNCKQELRAPRGRGKISVTCQKCNNKFIQKT